MNLICFSDVAWNFLWQRQHHLIANMPPCWKITYIEPSFLKSLGLKIINTYSQIAVPAVKNKNIHITSIPLIPLIDRWKYTRKLNEIIIIQSIKMIMEINRIEDPVFLFYNPRFAPTVKRIKHSLNVYDLIDDKMQFEAVPSWIEDYHNSLIDVADFVTVSSTSLLEKVKAKRKKDVFFVGNGVDTNHFHTQGMLKDTTPPIELQKIRSPILGYVGALGEWFDFDLLERVLTSRKKISIVLIGWVFNNQRHLLKKLVSRHKNLYFLGRRSYHVLPSYLKCFSAGIIPFKLDELTKSINPIKLLEYLAVGIPVISTPIPEVLKYAKGVYIADSSEQFIKQIDKVLISDHDKNELAETASSNDWKYKVDQFITLLESYLKDKLTPPR